MQTTIDHTNFDSMMLMVSSGLFTFYIQTALKTIKIDAKTINKFTLAGYSVLVKDSDGKGFRVQQGKQKNYVMQGYLVAVKN